MTTRDIAGRGVNTFKAVPLALSSASLNSPPPKATHRSGRVERRGGTAVAWNPSLRGGAKIEETYLIGERFELLTATPSWPLVDGPRGSLRSAVKVL